VCLPVVVVACKVAIVPLLRSRWVQTTLGKVTMRPNAVHEPRSEAGAEWTLEGVGSCR
jgi:hypothetical protein